jgi:hypothetical protein
MAILKLDKPKQMTGGGLRVLLSRSKQSRRMRGLCSLAFYAPALRPRELYTARHLAPAALSMFTISRYGFLSSVVSGL